MSATDLVFGLLDNSKKIGDPEVAAKFRDLTISWSRYGYHGRMIEAGSVDEIVALASQTRNRYCFIQTYGHVISEKWLLTQGLERTDFHSALSNWIRQNDFLATGALVGDAKGYFGFRSDYLLVDLETHRKLGAPSFARPAPSLSTFPKASTDDDGETIRSVRAAGGTWRGAPAYEGCQWVAASLDAGKPVSALPREVCDFAHDLGAGDAELTDRMADRLGDGIDREGADDTLLTSSQRGLIQSIRRQAAGAKQGVFLWNIEPYTDVETRPADFTAPVTELYSVAAGFKPNRILETHGFDESSKVCFFDYSRNALDIRRFMLREWDGRDYPSFCRRVFEAFPPPETFYQLWDDASPEQLRDDQVARAWESELSRWGGPDAFASHWQRYRELAHDFVCVDMVGEPERLIERIDGGDGTVIWWSNAFFTMFSNWFRSLDERRDAYRAFIDGLAAKAPRIVVYGSDDTNANVNGIRVGDYRELFHQAMPTPLAPAATYGTEIRM